ncbi:MAG: asparagine synthase (glutamine-hydrolyzing) [Desulfobacterales bacterium]|jgi:asparagine synthase (glutamine-hydrolysing)
MCGIAGILAFNNYKLPFENIQYMTKAMSRRGPDDEGFAFFHGSISEVEIFGGHATPEPVLNSNFRFAPPKRLHGQVPKNTHLALGHRRLSILDLSPAGHQPMCTEDGRYWIVHNGEIYNYNEIRKELESAGEYFFSDTDTEVILKAYRLWGAECLHRFNGMWAFAIWDCKKKQLFCSRDRVGIKPFYYYQTDKFIIFASDIKTLIASTIYKPEPDWEGVYHAMSFQCAPRPMTCFLGVKALEQAHWMTIDLRSQIRKQRFWQISLGEIDYSKSEIEWIRALDEVLHKSVERRLVSDVPVGTFMSGGIDSTTISAIASQKHPGIKAFTLAYEDTVPEMDELSQAKSTASMWPITHIWKRVKPNSTLSAINEITECYEEPSLSLGPIYIISKLVSKNKITVVLNGLGPDELFCGYGRHNYLPLWYVTRPFKKLLSPLSILDNRIGKLCKLAQCHDIFDYYVELISIFSEQEKKNLFSLENINHWNSPEKFKEIYKLNKKHFSNPIEAICYLDLINYIGNHHVYRGDLFSMHFSLENRFPYLDHELIEFVFKMPAKYKVKNGYGKYIQRKIAEKYIHQSCLNMKKKGFSLPLKQWMKTSLKHLVIEKLNRLKDRHVFKNAQIEKLKDSFYSKDLYHNQLWFLVSTELWLEQMIDRSSEPLKNIK